MEQCSPLQLKMYQIYAFTFFLVIGNLNWLINSVTATKITVNKFEKSNGKHIGQSGSDHFRVIWNSPTEKCHTKYGYDFKWEDYGIEVNKNDGWVGDKITIFYKNDLGIYPYFDDEGKSVNGGVPQAVNMAQHLAKAYYDIIKYIPDVNFTGLAVIDWEPWRPLWDRNWDSKKIYQIKSEDIVREAHPQWNDSEIVAEAEKEFTIAAREMLEKTVELGKKLRPGGKWGFYEFPECYNGNHGQKTCDMKARSQNDKLAWLFEVVSSEYPSSYLQIEWNNTHKAGFVHGQIQEGLRVADFGSKPPRPVFMYSRYQYQHLYPFYDQYDLVVTIKQAADFGIAGVVLWGDHYSEFNQSVCESLVTYVHTILGPTVANILKRTRSCENQYCESAGRCVLKNSLTAPQWLKFESLSGVGHHSGLEKEDYIGAKTRLSWHSNFYKCV